MAGYKKAAKVYRLKFEDDDLAGLEVRAKGVPLGTFLDLTAVADLQAGVVGPGQLEQVSRLFDIFADALVSWNLEEEDGTPVPATLDALKEQEIDFALQIVMAWMDAIAGVAAPLGMRSTGGGTIQEASLPMAPLSASQAS